MKAINQIIVRILLNHCKVLKHNDRLIQVIPNGDIEEMADEIERQVQSIGLSDVVGSLPPDEEIKKQADKALFGFGKGRQYDDDYNQGYIDGSKWIIDRIKGNGLAKN